MISFISKNAWGCTLENNCFKQIEIYMRVVFCFLFAKNIIFDFIFPGIRTAYYIAKRKAALLLDKTKESMKNLAGGGKSRKSVLQQIKNPFRQINEMIELEKDKNDFRKHFELNGTIDLYLEIALQFGVLCCYGLPFPLVFLLAFGANVFELFATRLKLMKMYQRPIPADANTIGAFNIYLDLMSYISVFTNW